jgi:hypothetical protein
MEKPLLWRGYIYNTLVAAKVLREHGSKNDIWLWVQVSSESNASALPSEDQRWLTTMGVQVRYLPKDPQEDFAEINMAKFRILTMTEYRRVLFLDADLIPLGNLDYLFNLSDVEDREHGPLFKENFIIPTSIVPSLGCFFILKPEVGAWEQIQQMVFDAQVNAFKQGMHFDIVNGFGHQIQHPDYWEDKNGGRRQNWTFYAAYFDQGMLYHWAKYVKKSVSIAFSNDRVENWGALMNGTIHLERTLLKPFANYSRPVHKWDRPCRQSLCDHAHFAAGNKPWTKGPPNGGIVNAENAFTSEMYYW